MLWLLVGSSLAGGVLLARLYVSPGMEISGGSCSQGNGWIRAAGREVAPLGCCGGPGAVGAWKAWAGVVRAEEPLVVQWVRAGWAQSRGAQLARAAGEGHLAVFWQDLTAARSVPCCRASPWESSAC